MEIEKNIEDYTEDIVFEIIRALEDIIKDARMNWFEILGHLTYKEDTTLTSLFNEIYRRFEELELYEEKDKITDLTQQVVIHIYH